MTLSVAICTQCGEPFDATGYSLCNDCKYDHRFIKLRKDDEKRKPSESQESDEGI
jgi:DNA-directed RNA polymerase subunit RPC12/RpoP